MQTICHPLKRTTILAPLAALLAALALSLAPSAAQATTASGYLARTYQLAGPCVGTYASYIGSYGANPSSWHDTRRIDHEDGDGIFKTLVYKEHGVARFSLYWVCTRGSNYHALQNPSAYAHRFIYENWVCTDWSCFYPPYTQTGAWSPGF